MARISKKRILQKGLGLPTKEEIMTQGGDDTPAVIQDQMGNPVAPAALKEGEIVFSVEAIIGAGQGDYDQGAKFLLELHDELKRIGEELSPQQQQPMGLPPQMG